MPITTADIQTVIAHIKELGLIIPREPSSDQLIFACAKDTPDSPEYRYGFSAIIGDAGITVLHFLGGKSYSTSIAIERFLELTTETIDLLVTQSREANEAYDDLQNQTKNLRKSYQFINHILLKG